MVSCHCDYYGSQDLGKNFTLLKGDRLEDNVIIYCSGDKRGCCTGGIYVIPTYEEHYDIDGKYNEYVEEAKSNEKWIVVRTIQKSNKVRYWLINKDFEVEDKYKDTPLSKKVGEELITLIQSQITGPLNASEYSMKIKELKINLSLE